MAFNPEKVTRTTLRTDMVRDTTPFEPGDEVVHAEDFDELVAMYKELRWRMDGLEK